MQDSVKACERNFYSNVLAIPVRYINEQITRERQSPKKKKKKKKTRSLYIAYFFHGSRQTARLSARLGARVRHKLLTHQKWNEWAQRKSVISDPKLKVLYNYKIFMTPR